MSLITEQNINNSPEIKEKDVNFLRERETLFNSRGSSEITTEIN